MTFFFGFDQALLFQRKHVVLHPLDLVATKAAALNVDRQTCQMRRSDLAFRRGCVAIVTAKFLLDFHRANRGVYLNLPMKLGVVGGAQIIQKFTRPGTAIAPVRIETRIEAKCSDRPQSAPDPRWL